ncbi:bacterioferritin [Falsihalocynthiibacter arcticus]|uniref:Bacterioferritin n=1 Tax=Falsihalocynthiibacter arcticus TaxID=1579316 RepID=A0A126V2K0_9RHOB|nr:bacterioferritin [Falsihalocynthiibacter arcticus]AML52367.1 bacterioferritin [Falsihalocynthiibacter arcticus]
MKGDKKVIEVLNKALRIELTAVSQFWLHYRLQKDWGYGKLAKKMREESIEEMEHADKLIDRILFLEGHPNLQTLDPLRIGENLRETLTCDLEAEMEAVKFYTEARKVCSDASDYASMHLFEQLILDEQNHVDFLETQIGLLDQIGVQNYGQLNADSADVAE